MKVQSATQEDTPTDTPSKQFLEIELRFKSASHKERLFYGIQLAGANETKSPLSKNLQIEPNKQEICKLRTTDFDGLTTFTNINIEQVRDSSGKKISTLTSVQVVAKEDGNKIIFDVTSHNAEYAALILENKMKSTTLTVDFEHSGGAAKNVSRTGILVEPGDRKCKDLPQEDLSSDRCLNYFIKF